MKFQFYFKKGSWSSKKISYERRVYESVDYKSLFWNISQKLEPILGYVPKNDEKKSLVHKGLIWNKNFGTVYQIRYETHLKAKRSYWEKSKSNSQSTWKTWAWKFFFINIYCRFNLLAYNLCSSYIFCEWKMSVIKMKWEELSWMFVIFKRT